MILSSIRALATTLPVRHIVGEDGTPYLSRYRLHGWIPDNQVETPCSVYLHNIHRADLDDALHSHPWAWSQTMVLHGGYRQTVGLVRGDGSLELGGEQWVAAGQSCRHPTGFVHRISEVLPDTWTLFFVGPKTSSWGFYVDGRGMVPWRERLAERGLKADY